MEGDRQVPGPMTLPIMFDIHSRGAAHEQIDTSTFRFERNFSIGSESLDRVNFSGVPASGTKGNINHSFTH
jgi:hypothetical protein